MNDHTLEPRFERDLRAVLEESPPADVPPALRAFVSSVPQREALGRPRRPLGRHLVALAAVAVTMVSLAVVMAGIALIGASHQTPVLPAGTQSPQPSPSATGEHRRLTLRVVPIDGQPPTVAELQAVSEVLVERMSVYQSSSGTSFLGQGADRLTVDVDVPSGDPGYLDRVTATLTAPGQVRFVPLGSSVGEPGQTIDPADPALFGGDAVTDASIASDQSGTPALDIVLSPGAAEAFAQWSATHVGTQFAITLDGRIELAPTVASPVSDGHIRVIPGATGAETIDRLAAVLRSGPLPDSVTLVPSGP